MEQETCDDATAEFQFPLKRRLSSYGETAFANASEAYAHFCTPLPLAGGLPGRFRRACDAGWPCPPRQPMVFTSGDSVDHNAALLSKPLQHAQVAANPAQNAKQVPGLPNQPLACFFGGGGSVSCLS